jgi:F-type H+-transporting ATPase subunit a
VNERFWLVLGGVRIPDTVVVTLAITAVVAVLLWLASRHMKTTGLSPWQAALESYVSWVRSTLQEMLGEDPTPYAPLIGTLMAFIAIANLMAVVPLVRPPTADLDTTVALALVVMLAVPYYGIRRHGLFGYLRKYAEPHPLLLPLNILGELTRTLALAVRLFGNAMSGHMIGGILLLVAGALVPVPLMVLSILTGLVQAYIFGILASVFIAAAVESGATPTTPTTPTTPPSEPAHG